MCCLQRENNVYLHCVKSAQIQSFFWSVFSRIRTEYREILREKCPNTEFFLVCILPHSGRIRRDTISLYLVRIRKNTDQKKLRIWTLFTQCPLFKFMSTVFEIVVSHKEIVCGLTNLFFKIFLTR